jgi:hypothetical protein
MLTIIAMFILDHLEYAKPENFSIFLIRPAIALCLLNDAAILLLLTKKLIE